MSQRIVKLQAENVKRIKAISISPNGSLVVIGGKNAQGKSSTLDAIEYALHGKSSHPGEPVRRGEKKATIILETDKYKVTRRFTQKGTSLVVEDKATKGARFGSPQKLLDELVGDICFDPLAFALMETKKQADLLKRLVGFDFSEIDAKRKKIYEKRTDNNRTIKTLKSKLDGMTFDADAPEEEVDVSKLGAEMQRRIEVNTKNVAERQGLERAQGDINNGKKRVLDLMNDIEQIQLEVKAKENDLEAQKIITGGLVDLNVEEIKTQIVQADETNQGVRSNAEFKRVNSEIEAEDETAQGCTDAIEALDLRKEEALAGADFPVPGLGFDGDVVMFNDLPFDQASGAERLKVSVAMGIKLNPDFKVMLIRDGSLLDEQSLATVAAMAEESDAQVWLETVSVDDAKCSVIIEDGMVKK